MLPRGASYIEVPMRDIITFSLCSPMAEQGVLIRFSRGLAMDSLGLRGRVDCNAIK